MTTISVPNARVPDRDALTRVAKGRDCEVHVLTNAVTVVFDGDLDEETRLAVVKHLRGAQDFLDITAPTLEQVVEQVRRLTRALGG